MAPNFTFDKFRFETETGRLWSGARELRLTPKAAAVLKVLLMRAGHPVTKEDLFTFVWDGVSVGDDALTSCVQELRRALADDAKKPRFIETRHRRGYQFVAPLTEARDEKSVNAAAQATKVPAIAVLPFADMSPAGDQDFFCDGLAEELINALTRIDGLRVASRTASFQFRSPGADVRSVGRHLNVDRLLEGSVRKADNRLRVTVQLIEVATGYHHWSQRFDRVLDDVFAIQDEIAERVVDSMRGGVPSLSERPSTLRPHTRGEAYEYYLRGRHYLHRMTQTDLESSGEMFERAIEIDSGYGPAWACLSAAHATLYEWFGSKEEDLSLAERACRKALELSPNLAEPHAAWGFVLSLSGRYAEAAREFEEAIRFNPAFFEAYYYFARSCFAGGEIARSAELFGKAADVRQEDFQSAMLQGQSLRQLGRMEESRVATREGVRRAERILMLNPTDARALSLGSGALFEDGQVERAFEWCQRALELHPEDMTTLTSAACLYAKAGQKEKSLMYLERVLARGWGKRDWIAQDSDYDILRDDPRFKKLLSTLK